MAIEVLAVVAILDFSERLKTAKSLHTIVAV